MILNIDKQLLLEAALDSVQKEYNPQLRTLKQQDSNSRLINGVLLGAPAGAAAGAGLHHSNDGSEETILPSVLGGALGGAVLSGVATPSIERGINNIVPIKYRSKDDYGNLTMKQRFAGDYS